MVTPCLRPLVPLLAGRAAQNSTPAPAPRPRTRGEGRADPEQSGHWSPLLAVTRACQHLSGRDPALRHLFSPFVSCVRGGR